MADRLSKKARNNLLAGAMIPVQPLVLRPDGSFDEQAQQVLTRYYRDAGAGGVAVGRAPSTLGSLYRPWLESAAIVFAEPKKLLRSPLLRIAFVGGSTADAAEQSRVAAELGHHLALLEVGEESADAARQRKRFEAVSESLPVFAAAPAGESHQVAYDTWRKLCETGRLAAVQISGATRPAGLRAARAVRDSGLDQSIPLYAGSDASAYLDLVSRFAFTANRDEPRLEIVGGVLRSWGYWTRRALDHFNEAKRLMDKRLPVSRPFVEIAAQMSDAATAVLDLESESLAEAGVLEILRRQGVLDAAVTLVPEDRLSDQHAAEIDRVYRDYPHLNDDVFVQTHVDSWFA